MGRINWSMAVCCCCCCCCCIFVTLPTLCFAGFPRQFSPAAAFPSDAAFVHTEGGLLYAYFALAQLSHQRLKNSFLRNDWGNEVTCACRLMAQARPAAGRRCGGLPRDSLRRATGEWEPMDAAQPAPPVGAQAVG